MAIEMTSIFTSFFLIVPPIVIEILQYQYYLKNWFDHIFLFVPKQSFDKSKKIGISKFSILNTKCQIKVKIEVKIEEPVYSLLYKVIKCQISIDICSGRSNQYKNLISSVKILRETGQQCHFRNSREEMELKDGQQCQFIQ